MKLLSKAPGNNSASEVRLIFPEVVARIIFTSLCANSAIFCRQPPHGTTGRLLSAITTSSLIWVSPDATIEAIAPASAQVPSG